MLQKSLQSPQCERKESRREVQIECKRKWSRPVHQFQNLARGLIEVIPGIARDYNQLVWGHRSSRIHSFIHSFAQLFFCCLVFLVWTGCLGQYVLTMNPLTQHSVGPSKQIHRHSQKKPFTEDLVGGKGDFTHHKAKTSQIPHWMASVPLEAFPGQCPQFSLLFCPSSLQNSVCCPSYFRSSQMQYSILKNGNICVS